MQVYRNVTNVQLQNIGKDLYSIIFAQSMGHQDSFLARKVRSNLNSEVRTMLYGFEPLLAIIIEQVGVISA